MQLPIVSATPILELAPELLAIIFDLLYGETTGYPSTTKGQDDATMKACSLVCSRFLPFARARLFSHLNVVSTCGVARALKASRVRGVYEGAIRTITIAYGPLERRYPIADPHWPLLGDRVCDACSDEPEVAPFIARSSDDGTRSWSHEDYKPLLKLIAPITSVRRVNIYGMVAERLLLSGTDTPIQLQRLFATATYLDIRHQRDSTPDTLPSILRSPPSPYPLVALRTIERTVRVGLPDRGGSSLVRVFTTWNGKSAILPHRVEVIVAPRDEHAAATLLRRLVSSNCRFRLLDVAMGDLRERLGESSGVVATEPGDIGRPRDWDVLFSPLAGAHLNRIEIGDLTEDTAQTATAALCTYRLTATHISLAVILPKNHRPLQDILHTPIIQAAQVSTTLEFLMNRVEHISMRTVRHILSITVSSSSLVQLDFVVVDHTLGMREGMLIPLLLGSGCALSSRTLRDVVLRNGASLSYAEEEYDVTRGLDLARPVVLCLDRMLDRGIDNTTTNRGLLHRLTFKFGTSDELSSA